MSVPLIFSLIPPNTIFQHFRPIPNVQFTAEEQFPCFSHYTRKSYEAYPPPRHNKSDDLPLRQGRRVDTVSGREDASDEFGMVFGGAEGYGVVYSQAAGCEIFAGVG